MTVTITQQTRRLMAPPMRATSLPGVVVTRRTITQTNKRNYDCQLTKDQVADLMRGEMEQYYPEPTQAEWEAWCSGMDEAYEGGFR